MSPISNKNTSKVYAKYDPKHFTKEKPK